MRRVLALRGGQPAPDLGSRSRRLAGLLGRRPRHRRPRRRARAGVARGRSPHDRLQRPGHAHDALRCARGPRAPRGVPGPPRPDDPRRRRRHRGVDRPVRGGLRRRGGRGARRRRRSGAARARDLPAVPVRHLPRPRRPRARSCAACGATARWTKARPTRPPAPTSRRACSHRPTSTSVASLRSWPTRPSHYDIPVTISHILINRFLPFDERVLVRVYAVPVEGSPTSGGGLRQLHRRRNLRRRLLLTQIRRRPPPWRSRALRRSSAPPGPWSPSDGPTTPRCSSRSMRRPARAKPTLQLALEHRRRTELRPHDELRRLDEEIVVVVAAAGAGRRAAAPVRLRRCPAPRCRR